MIRLAVRAPAAHAEEVLGAMLEMAPSGIEQVDDGDTVEFAVYGSPGELPELEEGEAEVAGVRVVVSAAQVPDDWEERWKAFHTPVLVGDRIYVRPPWEAPVGAEIDLEIDPGRAFGTGAHSTTRLCLALLVDVDPGGSVVDLGCGSGVLAIAAARLGFGPVTALDADPLAIDATEQNARANGVTLDRVARANLRDEQLPAADLVLANLMRPLLLRVAELMTDPPRTLIASGLLDEEADEVAAAFAPMREVQRYTDKGWSALRLSATPSG